MTATVTVTGPVVLRSIANQACRSHLCRSLRLSSILTPVRRFGHRSELIWRCRCCICCAGIDVSRILTPAATLRPGAAQTCQTQQDHGLETGLDLPELIGACASALPDDGAPPQPVYHETSVCNVRAT